MSDKFQEIYVDIIAMIIISSATYHSVFTDTGVSVWGVQLAVGIVVLVSPLSKLGATLLEWLKNKSK